MVYSSLDILDIAINIEINGKLFYTKAAESTSNIIAKRALLELAGKEDSHADFFKKLSKQVQQNQIIFTDSNEFMQLVKEMADTHVFVKSDIGLEIEKIAKGNLSEIFGIAIQFEKDTIVFFNEIGQKLSGESKFIIDQIISEESEHIRILNRIVKELNLVVI